MPDKIKLSEEATQTSARERLLKKVRTIKTHTLLIDGEPIEFKVQGLSRKEIDALQTRHQPRKNNEADRGSAWNNETFPPGLMAESVLEPKLTEEEWTGLWKGDDWSTGELNHIFDLCFRASNGGFDVPRSVSG